MTKKAVSASVSVSMTGPAARRAVGAALLCAVLAACGTRHAGEAAAPPSPVPAHETCGLDRDLTTDDDGAGAGNAGPPTDEETGYAGPPTDEETGYAGPPTDEETGYAGPPTDEETGYAGPPTDEETGYAGPPTDPDVTNGAGPCGGAGWFDMTRDFNAYYAEHRTAEDRFLPAQPVRQAKVRTAGGAGEAVLTFATRSVGKGVGEDARRLARVFTAWRQQVYGDKGTVSVRTTGGEVITTAPW
ncbi:hypothetical protein AB0B01_18705 [Streptomyces sp. NPDC044571]|uniref:hypothetical protein n=1 Tax=Streptomyces sp. NPDC044571 TaxID=3155371 RepID=UPI003403FAB9